MGLTNFPNAIMAGGRAAQPSLLAGGGMLLDPRGTNEDAVLGLGTAYRRVLSGAPAAAAAANIAPVAHAASGTALPLVTTTGAGVTVVATAFTALPSGVTIPVGTCALDGVAGVLAFPNLDLYDNSKAFGRAVSVTGVSGGTGGNVLIKGADIYGYAMSELIAAAAGAATTNGKKAFKYIYSATPQFTDAHNYSVGTADVFGIPLVANHFTDLMVWWNEALLTAATGFTAADATSPATTTTGDVRGTYAVQSASDGSKRLVIAVGIGEAHCADAGGMFGVAQV